MVPCRSFRTLFWLLLAASLLGALPCLAQEPVADLERLSQDVRTYLPPDPDRPLLEGAAREETTARFLKRHFSPWAPDFPLPDAAKARKGWQDLAGSEGLGENRRPVPASLRRSWLEAACAAPFGEENRCGVVLLPADLRLLPTSRALFEPLTRDGGGGYPFDQLQNSTLKPGEAVRLLHRTPDGAWAFVAAGTASGWVESSRVAPADEAFRSRWLAGPYLAVLDDPTALKDETGRFRCLAPLGTLLPRTPDGAALIPVADEATGLARGIPVHLPEGSAAPFPLEATPRNLAETANRLVGQTYGWGGSFGLRDCSATTRDLFLPFGVWVPRNSGEQAKLPGRDLASLSPMDREAALMREGVPFATLVHMKGHILLYLGPYEGRPLVLHNFWSLRTRDTGRILVGRCAVTTLTPGAERRDLDPEKSLLHRVRRMVFPLEGRDLP